MDISRIRFLATFYNNSERAEDAKMLLDIPYPINQVINDQLVFSLVDICLDNMLLILCKSLLCFAKIGKIDDYSKIAKIWLVKF